MTNLDDETIKFAPRLSAVNESAGTATFTVVLSGAPETGNNVTVVYTTKNGSALLGNDYTANQGTVTFTRANLTKTFTVPIINDTVGEDGEAFT